MPQRWVDAVVALLEQRSGEAAKTIAIDGHSAAGKSTFATALAERLTAAVIPGDDFYRVMPEPERAELSPQQGIDDYYDWQRMRREALVPLRARTSVIYQPYNWHTGQLDDIEITIEPAEIIIAEGLFVSRPQLSDLIDIAVLVEAPADLRWARQHERADATDDWLERWDAAERLFFHDVRPPETYDVVVSPEGSPTSARQAAGSGTQGSG